jgi:hypothetical protein
MTLRSSRTDGHELWSLQIPSFKQASGPANDRPFPRRLGDFFCHSALIRG